MEGPRGRGLGRGTGGVELGGQQGCSRVDQHWMELGSQPLLGVHAFKQIRTSTFGPEAQLFLILTTNVTLSRAVDQHICFKRVGKYQSRISRKQC